MIEKVYETYEKASAAFGKRFSGKYIVLHYQEYRYSEHYGSRKHGVWYKREGYVDGTFNGSADNVHWYELFRIGPRGGIKRLGIRMHMRPEAIAMLEKGHPAYLTAICSKCTATEEEYTIDPLYVASVLDEIPNSFLSYQKEQERRKEEAKKLRQEEMRKAELKREELRKAELEREKRRNAERTRYVTYINDAREAKKPLTTNMGDLLRKAGF